ncbi:MAG: recombination protein RecR [Coxiellaceae bacterium]|nr:recombination protein RecR [Coxiellaceae bacterium]
MFSPLTQQLIDALRCLPSVGPKSAQRMAFELLSENGQAKGLQLSNTLKMAIENVGNCERCQTYTEETLCNLCQNQKRNANLLCIVETPADIIAIEQANMYSGLYFVLHGHLSPLDGIGPKEIGIPKLLERIEKEAIEEVILATNPTMEGKATASYIVSQVNPKVTKCTRIAHGVPLGGELEYLDSGTLTHAFYSRVQMQEE